MKYYINYCDTSGFDILPSKLFTTYQFPAEFILALCRDEYATYTGTIRALMLFLDNSRIHALLDSKSDRYCPYFKARLASLRNFISFHSELLK